MLPWIIANKAMLISWAYFLANYINGALPYDDAHRLAHSLLDVVCFTTRGNSPNSVKVPMMRSQAPDVGTKDPTVRVQA